MATDMGSANGTGVDGAAQPPVAPPKPRRRVPVVMWIFAVVALGLAIALAVITGRPGIAIAGVLGVALPILVVVAVRLRRSRRRAARVLGFVGVGVALLIVAVGIAVLSEKGSQNGSPPGAVRVERVGYHGAGRIVGDDIVVDETIVLDERTIADLLGSGAGDLSKAPTVTITGWQEAALVDGYPSFERTRQLPWDRTSNLADTATLSLALGSASATLDDHTSGATLVAENGSKVEFVLPKGGLGAAVPAPASRTDVPTADHQEVVVFDVDSYADEVSFDVLHSALRNPAGHALYNVAQWGFWQWAAGAATTVLGGFIVDKGLEAVWRLLFRRARSALRRGHQAADAA